MMKKSQIDLAGLMIVMLLIAIAMIFIIKFQAPNETNAHKKEFAQTETASNMLSVFLASTSRDCNHLSMAELLQDCSRDLNMLGIKCAGMGSCDYVGQEAKEIFGKTLEEWKVDYEFKAFKDEENPIIHLGKKCGANKKSKTFPLPTNPGILYVRLDICG